MSLRRFVLRPEHIKLLRAAWVDWCDDEFGAPAIDPKRPYGNSYVLGDIAEILNLPRADEDGFGEDQAEAMYLIHGETQVALQVILATGSFEPGEYVCDQHKRDWRRA